MIAAEILNHHENPTSPDGLESGASEVPPEIFRTPQADHADAGLSQVYPDFNTVPFAHFIASARQIDVCKTYGGGWLKQTEPYFAQALRRRDANVRFCTLSPESPGLAGFSHHFSGMRVEVLKAKIEEGTADLRQAIEHAGKSGPTGRLRIYRMTNLVNHSFYRFDDLVLWAPRPLASSKNASTPIPCFAYRKTDGQDGFFHWLMRDFHELIGSEHDCTLHFDSEPPPSLPIV